VRERKTKRYGEERWKIERGRDRYKNTDKERQKDPK
jgi:hypothetical protein